MEKDKPLFSVLIANYNNAAYLKETLQSVYSQTYTNWEIILVDDCSTDNSQEIYNSLKDDNRIKIFYNEKNKGCGYTKRRCVEEATGTICGFVDPDDAISSNALEKMVEMHIANPTVSLIHSKLNYCDEHLNIKSVYTAAKHVQAGLTDFYNLDGAITHFCTFKKEYYDKTEGIDPYLQKAVDQDLYLKLYDAGKTLFLDKAFYFYRIHSRGISTNTSARKAYYWHWFVIFNTSKRRNINIENMFFDYFTPRHEYVALSNQYDKYRKIDKVINKIKRLVSK